ncbi:hypothetical protein LY90DRAFT_62130 [Neocallimastix californiae]|uniref:Uncharacterized protein n=1 Tax=Neocallimastix californiae TaxID=1754190 RepID=A0A1Y2F5N8_9FUNG|nr:hypothetical protein LY90DRAFT_62130 [Neocallimastix californiae]|eukprot:ORY79228.1 hypothetical protein LY90DRAFT_62130 [Neocallimastix californiae]
MQLLFLYIHYIFIYIYFFFLFKPKFAIIAAIKKKNLNLFIIYRFINAINIFF